MEQLLKKIKACEVCKDHLPLGSNPVVRCSETAKILIVGQAPGTKVHKSGIPWDDASGKRLREWMQVDNATFYNEKQIAIVPMAFCYPGKGKSGDLPPRKECAPLWHEQLLSKAPNIQLTLLIGQYAQNYYLKDKMKANLTETVKHFRDYLPGYIALPHPSPRNEFWLRRNQWFSEEVLPELRHTIAKILAS